MKKIIKKFTEFELSILIYMLIMVLIKSYHLINLSMMEYIGDYKRFYIVTLINIISFAIVALIVYIKADKTNIISISIFLIGYNLVYDYIYQILLLGQYSVLGSFHFLLNIVFGYFLNFVIDKFPVFLRKYPKFDCFNNFQINSYLIIVSINLICISRFRINYMNELVGLLKYIYTVLIIYFIFRKVYLIVGNKVKNFLSTILSLSILFFGNSIFYILKEIVYFKLFENITFIMFAVHLAYKIKKKYYSNKSCKETNYTVFEV